MDAKEQLKDDVRSGRVSVDRLIDLIFTLQQRIAELEKKLAAASSPTIKIDEPYSMKAEEKRQAGAGGSVSVFNCAALVA